MDPWRTSWHFHLKHLGEAVGFLMRKPTPDPTKTRNVCLLPSLKLTNKIPENRCKNPKEKVYRLPNQQFSGAMLVAGRVIVKTNGLKIDNSPSKRVPKNN